MTQQRTTQQIREDQMLMLSRDAIEWVRASRRGDHRGMKNNVVQITDNIDQTLGMILPLKRLPA